MRSLSDQYRILMDRLYPRRRLRSKPRKVSEGFFFSSNKSFFSERWEVRERALVSSLLPKTDLFINFGAYHGYYCCLALKANVPAIAFEPISENCTMIAKNVMENGLEENFSLFPVAVSNRTGFAEMYGLNRSDTSLIRGFSNTADLKTSVVPVHKIDDVIQRRIIRRKRVLVLMDIEGSEAYALECAKTLLQADPKPIWIIEVFPKKRHEELNPAHRVFGTMFDAGYTAFSFNGSVFDSHSTRSSLVKIMSADIAPDFEGGNIVFCSNEIPEEFTSIFLQN